MERIYSCCCGIDVHKKIIVACLLKGSKKEIRELGTTTRQIQALCDWLMENDCEMVAMESTGSYWKPLFNILEANEIPTIVVNAQHMKAVPGRKTDVKDSEWIADLLRHGLLKASFIPPRPQRELKEMCAYRKSLIQTKSAELNRLQKMLEGANVKLSGTVSDINGMSARTLLDLSLAGEVIDEKKLEILKSQKRISPRLKATSKQLEEDLEGAYSPMQIRMIREVRQHIEELDRHIEALNADINHFLDSDEKKAVKLLKTVPGISDQSAQQIIAVIGTDMSRFPTSKHLCSWAGIAPGNNESAKKARNAKTTKGNKLLKTTLVGCAHAAVKVKDSYLNSLYTRVSAHRGKKRAIVAVALSILKSIYFMLSKQEPYEELGGDYFDQFNKEKKINHYLKKLEKLGYTASPIPDTV